MFFEDFARFFVRISQHRQPRRGGILVEKPPPVCASAVGAACFCISTKNEKLIFGNSFLTP
jgi:hypothetical protein